MSVHIHAPPAKQITLERVTCYDKKCKKKTWHVVRSVPWYGFDACCLRCGRCWVADGEKTHCAIGCGRGAKYQRERNKKGYRVAYRNFTGGKK